MKIISVHELEVGDVFAKEIKLHSRQAFQVLDKPKNKNYLIVQQRGENITKNFNLKEGAQVYFLRNIND